MSTPFTALIVFALLASSSFACSKDGAGSKNTALSTETTDGGLVPGPPPSDDWDQVDVSNADVRVRIPSGASVPPERAGRDAKFAGSYFRVVMPSGYDVLFAERHGSETGDIAAEKRAFDAKTMGRGAIVYDAADAFVIRRDDGADAGGPYCETTACATVGDRRICATATGARIDGTVFEKLTDTECLAVVTVARSIKAR